MSHAEPEIRLLLVDDEREFLEAMKTALGRRGFHVTTAPDGATALQLLATRGFDLVVLDVKMPGIDGVEVFHQITRLHAGLPVILLTGHGSIEQAFQTSREGVQDYLAKPCDVDVLARAARDALERGARARPAPASRVQPEIRLLLVDDEVEFVRSIQPALERRGMSVTAVHTGRAALELVREERFEVAVIDVVMPGMDGLTLLDRLQEDDPLLQVIILTGNPQVGDVRRGLRQGAFDYLVKPCGIEELTRVIRAAQQRRRHQVEQTHHATADEIIAARPD